MKVNETKLPGVKVIELSRFEDFRGYYLESYNEELYQQHGIDIKFVQDDFFYVTKACLKRHSW